MSLQSPGVKTSSHQFPPIPTSTQLTTRREFQSEATSPDDCIEHAPLTPPEARDEEGLRAAGYRREGVRNIRESVKTCIEILHQHNEKDAVYEEDSLYPLSPTLDLAFDPLSFSQCDRGDCKDGQSHQLPVAKRGSQQDGSSSSTELLYKDTDPPQADFRSCDTDFDSVSSTPSGSGSSKHKFGVMYRSLSQSVAEPRYHQRQLHYKSLIEQSQQQQQQQQEQQQEQQITKENFQRKQICRSQSDPMTLDESEYSKYWRGDVTVIESPTTSLPVLELAAPTGLDEDMTESPITRAIIKGDNSLVLECLRQGENPTRVCTNTGKNYLHVVASVTSADQETRWVPMVYQLSNAGLDMDARDREGQTAVRIAINRRQVQLLAALLKCGATADETDVFEAEQVRGVVKPELMETIRRLTPSYWTAVHDLTPFKVNRLVKAWSRVNLSRDGKTLVEYAKQNARDEQVVKLLLQHEASIELAHAVMAGDVNRAQVLMCDSAVDLGTCDTSVKNNYLEPFAPLSLIGAALKYGHAHMLEVLKDAERTKGAGQTAAKKDFSPVDEGPSTGSPTRNAAGKGASGSSSKESVFIYRSSNGGTCEMRQQESVTSSLCVIL